MKGLLTVISIALFIGWAGLARNLERHSPVTPNIESVNVYPFHIGGRIVYITSSENILLYALPGSGMFIFFIVMRLHSREQQKW